VTAIVTVIALATATRTLADAMRSLISPPCSLYVYYHFLPLLTYLCFFAHVRLSGWNSKHSPASVLMRAISVVICPSKNLNKPEKAPLDTFMLESRSYLKLRTKGANQITREMNGRRSAIVHVHGLNLGVGRKLDLVHPSMVSQHALA
jgi:hypothetical protein